MKSISEHISFSLPDVPKFKSVLALWFRNYQTRKALKDMEEHRLLDIGIDRTQAKSESHKPFWR